MAHIYSGDVFERAVARDHLEARLDLNKKYQSTDFDSWLMERLNVEAGEFVLDVGCGTGAQSIPILERVGVNGAVCSLDISADSINTLLERAGCHSNLTAVCSDMANIKEVISEKFPHKKFDLAQSSYALYYSPQRLKVLDTMKSALKEGGRLAVFTPNEPHGLVEFARSMGPIPEEIDDSIRFGPTVLEPYFRKSFWDVSVHFFHNIISVSRLEDAVTFYRSTTYYLEELEPEFSRRVSECINSLGAFRYEKNGYLIIGRNPF